MSEVSKYVQRLKRQDPTLDWVDFFHQNCTDSELAELMDCLPTHHGVFKVFGLSNNLLTDKTGVKLARYVAVSFTIDWLNIARNQFSSETYLALAAALRVNSSLRILLLYNNQAVEQTFIDAAFVDALRFNPVRPAKSNWTLFDFGQKDFKRLKDAAEKSTPPSMLEFLLCAHLNTEKN